MKKHTHSFIGRMVLGAGLSLGVLAGAALGGAGELVAAGPLPTLQPLQVLVGGHEATVQVRGSEAMAFTYSLTPVSGPGAQPATTNRPPSFANVLNAANSVQFFSQADTAPVYEPAAQFKLAGLKSSTTYNLEVKGTTPGGQVATAQRSFTTLKQRVRITLDSVTITDDGDWVGNGEPTWYWQVLWSTASVKDCYPQSAGRCSEGNKSEGTFTPLTGAGQKFSFLLAEENFQPIVDPAPQPGSEDFTTMPQSIRLRTRASESDSIPNPFDVSEFHGAGEATWQVPQGVERAEQQFTLKANADGFRSTMTFTFLVFYDSATYAPNDGRVHSTSK